MLNKLEMLLMNDKSFKVTKWTYTTGAIGRDMNYTLVSMFLITYIQFTMNLTTAQFSALTTIIVVCRIIDAITDPIMGVVIESVRLNYGKFKPWIIIGAVANSIFTVSLFVFRPEGWAFVVFFGFAYFMWGITYTINDISYWSMLPALTSDAEARDQIATLLVVFATIGSIAAAGLIPIFVVGDAVKMYAAITVVIAMVFLGCSLMTGICVKERPRGETEQEKIKLRDMFKIIKGNDQLVIMAIVVLVYTLGSGLQVAFGFNFFTFEYNYSVGGEKLFVFTVMYALGTLVPQMSYGIINKRLKRKQILHLSMIITAIGYFAFMAFGYILPRNDVLLYSIGFIIFFGQGLFYVAMIIMFTNTIEYNEYITGNRYESLVFSLRPFMVKMATAIQQGIVTLILIVSGIYSYSTQIAVLEQQKGKNLITMEQVFTKADEIVRIATTNEYMLIILRIGMTIVPLILLFIGYYLSVKKYKIDEEMYDKIVVEINNRKINM